MRSKILCVCFVVLFAAVFMQSARAQNFEDWTSPVNIGSPPNAPREDWQPFVTKDGLSLYFVRGVFPNSRMWVAKRTSTEEAWGQPELLPATINSAGLGYPFVTADGHWLYFNMGSQGVVRSWRQNKKVESGPGGWQAPVGLGLQPSRQPWLFEDEETGDVILYFSSERNGNLDLFQSTMQPDGTFGPPVEVAGINLNTAEGEIEPSVSHNGRELYFSSSRPGSILSPSGVPSRDIWVSTRESTLDDWSEPQPVTSLNSAFTDGRPALAWDGKTMYFYSARPGNVDQFFDIWMTTREKGNE